jgi:hypothetical protein
VAAEGAQMLAGRFPEAVSRLHHLQQPFYKVSLQVAELTRSIGALCV